MKLTCVTAVYNAVAAGNRERLVRCIQSVAALKIDHEHLIYDGASTDGTLELLRVLEARTSNMKVVSEKDTGIYNALNKGVRDACGEWFYVIGCDDYIKFPQTLDRILSDRHGRAQVLATYVVKDFGTSQRLWPFSRRNLLFGTPYGHQGVLMKTSLVRALKGFDETYKLAADFDMMQRCHLQGVKIRYVKEVFAVFTAGGASEDAKDSHGVDEPLLVMKKNLGLSDAEILMFRNSMRLPILRLCRFAFNRDSAVRLSAYYLLVRMLLASVSPCLRRGIYK